LAEAAPYDRDLDWNGYDHAIAPASVVTRISPSLATRIIRAISSPIAALTAAMVDEATSTHNPFQRNLFSPSVPVPHPPQAAGRKAAG
jgi:hypothetical protein